MVWLFIKPLDKHYLKFLMKCLLPLYDDLNTPGYIANLHKLFDLAIKGDDNDKKKYIYISL